MKTLLYLTTKNVILWFFFILFTYRSSAEKIVIEAENFLSLKKPFKQVTITKQNIISKHISGKSYIEVPQGAGNGSQAGGETTYKIKVSQSGKYTFWARVWWLDSCGNSFIFVLDKNPPVIFGNDGTYKAWHWMKSRIKLNLTKGPHTLIIKNREDGVKIDQILLSNEQNFQPIGIEQG